MVYTMFQSLFLNIKPSCDGILILVKKKHKFIKNLDNYYIEKNNNINYVNESKTDYIHIICSGISSALYIIFIYPEEFKSSYNYRY